MLQKIQFMIRFQILFDLLKTSNSSSRLLIDESVWTGVGKETRLLYWQSRVGMNDFECFVCWR